ncbi:aldehyde dehydrogenase family protein, partial [Streptomyces massasporeus]|uniref:aldehyde dehydrogenase family protein n=1 Tax=Streptomyces massasporeus TaxID=67324 RepID=UPI0033EAE704
GEVASRDGGSFEFDQLAGDGQPCHPEHRGGARRLRHGTVWINDYHPYVPQAEWGGFGHSGVGRELGPTGLEEYREAKHIWQNIHPRPQHWFRG